MTIYKYPPRRCKYCGFLTDRLQDEDCPDNPNNSGKVTLTLTMTKGEFTKLGHSMSVAGFTDLVKLSKLFFKVGE